MPAVDNDRLVFMHVAIGPDGTVFAAYYDQLPGADSLVCGLIAFSNDGKQLWRRTYPGSDISAPVVDRDGTVFFVASSTAYALSSQGDELWSQELPSSQSWTSGVAIAADGTLLAENGGSLTGIRAAAP
jgi:outer membrane protein assembly factor BamB